MPGGRGKAVRSCRMCKWYKFAGNSLQGDGRYPYREAELRRRTNREMMEYQ